MPESSPRWSWTLLLVALLVAGAVAPLAAGTGHPGTDNTVTRLEVESDGDATWILKTRTRLETDDDVRTYESFQETFRENRSAYLGEYRDQMTSIVETASNDTGREMAARNFTAETSVQAVPRRWGVVTYEFAWDGFAGRQGDAVLVGDVFENGLLIAENDTLQLVAPDGYAARTVEPEPDDSDGDQLVWRGREDFADGQPAARLEPASAPSDPTDTGRSWVGVLGLLGAAVLAIGGAVAYRTVGDDVLRRVRGETVGDDENTTETDASGVESDVQSPPPENSVVSDAGPVSDRDRVRDLLRANDGQMKQSEIVDEVDWSKSKVSRVVAKLDEDGVVSKVRIGRENVVRLEAE